MSWEDLEAIRIHTIGLALDLRSVRGNIGDREFHVLILFSKSFAVWDRWKHGQKVVIHRSL